MLFGDIIEDSILLYKSNIIHINTFHFASTISHSSSPQPIRTSCHLATSSTHIELRYPPILRYLLLYLNLISPII
jgi:hypothetical protein